MPELPEVETTRRGIAPHLEGQKIDHVTIRNHKLRWPIPSDLAEILVGQTIHSVSRRAKYLLFQCDTGLLIIHLGMSGHLQIVNESDPIAKHSHFEIQLENELILRLTDPRRFGAVLWTDQDLAEHKLLAHLGPEPLTEDFDPQYLFARSRKRKQAIKTFLMDSKVVVGVGNIYANEALFLAGIRPTRAAGSLSRAAFERLHEKVQSVLSHAIKQGGTTLKDFVGGDGKPGYFKQELRVYGRGGEPCVECGKALKEIQIAKRATVYCTACQS